jgi:uncharacterized Fe-S cluster protein YjdI
VHATAAGIYGTKALKIPAMCKHAGIFLIKNCSLFNSCKVPWNIG